MEQANLQAKSRADRLPIEKRFKPGKSGNPRGGSKKATIRKLMKDYTTTADDEAIAKIIVERARRGVPFFVETYLDRKEGKVPNKQEVTGKDGIPLAVNITFRTKEAADASDLLRKKFESGN